MLDPITAEQLIKSIKLLICKFEEGLKKKGKITTDELKQDLAAIQGYFNSPDLVHEATYDGGMAKIKEEYAPFLLRISLYISNDPEIENIKSTLISHHEKAVSICQVLSLHAQQYKVERAYFDLYSGKKFKKAGLKFSDPTLSLLQQENPIAQQSKQNITLLMGELESLGGGGKYYNLREDEIELFGYLLNLPYRLQHATNYYYPMLNAGSLDSYTEIQRHNSDYQSTFSTKGNIIKLGNGGFVFFRLYVEPVNSRQTRYGDTSLIFDINLLRKCGWVSLHDQLNPFPGKSPNSRHLYWEGRLLRTSEAAPIENTTQDKTLHDGLLYRYRTAEITSYGGKKDVLKSFREKIDVIEQTRSFLNEMFYAEDILPGIALSIIRELRLLEQCGFRAKFLKDFADTTDLQERTVLLGELTKGFFRIEGKYPAAIRLQTNPSNQITFFKPVSQTDVMSPDDRRLVVTNPDGDSRFNQDMTVNPVALKTANLIEKQRSLTEKLSINRRQHARFKGDGKKAEEFKRKIANLEKQLAQINQQINQDKSIRDGLIKYFVVNFEIEAGAFEKVSATKMQLIQNYYTELLEEKIVTLEAVLLATTKQLRLIAADPFIDLLVDEQITFSELISCPLKELEMLSRYDISKPIIEKNMTISELVALYRQNPSHLDYLTCDDLFDLVLDLAPDVDPLLLEYAQNEDVDIAAVGESLCETDRALFHSRLENNGDDEPKGNYPEELDDDYSGEEPNYHFTEYAEDPVETESPASEFRL